MSRTSALVTNIGIDHTPWIIVDKTTFVPGDTGQLGNHQVLRVVITPEGETRHYISVLGTPSLSENPIGTKALITNRLVAVRCGDLVALDPKAA